MLLEVRPEGAPSFLCEATATCAVQAVLERALELNHLRTRLADAAAALPPPRGSKRGRDADEPPDEGGEREAAAAAAAEILDDGAVRRKQPANAAALRQACDRCEACAGGGATAKAPLVPGEFGLFFSGRWLEEARALGEYAGRNEKSKVTVQLRRREQLQPTEQPPQEPAPREQPPPEPEASAAEGLSLSSYFQHARARPGPSGAEPPPTTDDDDIVLSAEQRAALLADKAVGVAMRDGRLSCLLREIDSAPSREIALARLDGALNADEHFDEFARDVLRAVGARDAADDAA